MPGSEGTLIPYEIGERYEATLSARQRREGSHYTPRDVAEFITHRAVGLWRETGRPEWPVIGDPSCGGGVFLISAADHLLALGAPPRRIVNELVVGIDVDPGAVAASTAALQAWSSALGVPNVTPRVILGDALTIDPVGQIGPVGPIDVVVGNPPFQSQMEGRTARSEAERHALKGRFGIAAGGYVDIAALFALWAIQRVELGGVVGLIQPRSFLVARDAAAIRGELLRAGAMPAVWLPGSKIFAAHVDVCATFHQRSTVDDLDARDTTAVLGGRSGTLEHGRVERAELEDGSTWSAVWAVAQGVPPVPAVPAASQPARRSGAASRPGAPLGTVGTVASATAGFRDQYYGLLDHLREECPGRGAKVASTAMIDPAACRWSEIEVVIAKRRRCRPWLDLDALRASNETLHRWVEGQLVPKVLVATQTRVIEAVVDVAGAFVPLTPIISVIPTGDGVSAAHLEAALLAPAASAWAMRRFGGAGLSSSALKLAARQVLEIPLPIDVDAWDDAVSMIEAHRSASSGEFGRAGWVEIATTLNAAWGIRSGATSRALAGWWIDRLPASLR